MFFRHNYFLFILKVIRHYERIHNSYKTALTIHHPQDNEISLKEKNLFIFYHLLAVARMLIRSFVKNCANHYIYLFTRKNSL